jgi:hypothetical protein
MQCYTILQERLQEGAQALEAAEPQRHNAVQAFITTSFACSFAHEGLRRPLGSEPREMQQLPLC